MLTPLMSLSIGIGLTFAARFRFSSSPARTHTNFMEFMVLMFVITIRSIASSRNLRTKGSLRSMLITVGGDYTYLMMRCYDLLAMQSSLLKRVLGVPGEISKLCEGISYSSLFISGVIF